MAQLRLLHLEHCPDALRGYLTKYMNEVAPFLFVEKLNEQIAQVVWEKVCEYDKVDAMMLSANNSVQGYSQRIHNLPKYEPKDFDGIWLVGHSRNVARELFEKALAKTSYGKGIVAHCIEVAVIAREFCLNGILARLIETYAKKFKVDYLDLVSTITFIASIHDIGKLHPDFQLKIARAYEEKYEGEGGYLSFLLEEGLCNREYGMEEEVDVCRHEKYGAYILEKDLFLEDPSFHHLKERKKLGKMVPSLTKMAKATADVVSFHHQGKEADFRYVTTKDGVQDTWREVQKSFYDTMKAAYPPKVLHLDNDNYVDLFFKTVLGIVHLADFLASNNKVLSQDILFRNTTDIDKIRGYDERCGVEVRQFLMRNHIRPLKLKEDYTFLDLFPFIKEVRPMQKKAQEVLEKYGADNIALMIIEDSCGAGKTEAGLYAAAKMVSESDLSGIYIAMPTKATAEAILPRVKDCFHNLEAGLKTELFTSNAMFVENEAELGEGEMEAWLNVQYYKMLYPLGVGSIDQPLKGIRKEKYGLIRFNGVMSKCILADEIHAYDGYTLRIIENLVEHCAMVDNPVVVMSATLPDKNKKRLVESVRISTDRKDLPAFEPKQGYPLLTVVLKNGEVYQHEMDDCLEQAQKTYRFQFKPYLNRMDRISLDLLDLVRDGGCVGCILNTVEDAKKVYKQLRFMKDSDTEIFLYHSRFVESQKISLTKELSFLFGKEGKRVGKRPKKAIVISTQILEQSIDLDFDYLCTALPPIDSLIQRIGRLHRHSDIGTYREHHKIEIPLTIYVPDREEGANEGYGDSGRYIYGDSILEETERVLLDNNGKLVFPMDVRRMINEVYNRAQVRDDGCYAEIGNLNVNRNGRFEISDRDFRLSKSQLGTRKEDYPTMDLVLLTQEEFAKASSCDYDWNKEDALNYLQNRTVTVQGARFDSDSVRHICGKHLLKGRVLVPCKIYKDPLGEEAYLVEKSCLVYSKTYGLAYDKDFVEYIHTQGHIRQDDWTQER